MKMRCALGVACALVLSAPAFAGFDEIIDFEDQFDGTDVNGLVNQNATFSFLGLDRGFGAFVSGSVPPTTNTAGNVVTGPAFGTLGVKFAQPVTRFGFGFGLFIDANIEDAVCVDLYDENDEYLGTVKSDAENGDPVLRSFVPSSGYLFAEGFGCVGSLVITFSAPDSLSEDIAGINPNFIFDNLGYDFCDIVVPLPTPALMGGAGLLALGAVRRRRTV